MKEIVLNISGKQINPPGEIPHGTFSPIIRTGITMLLVLAVILAILSFIWGGINWITSGGDKQKIQAARARITYSIIGLVVALLAFAIVAVVGRFFGISLFSIIHI